MGDVWHVFTVVASDGVVVGSFVGYEIRVERSLAFVSS